MPVLDASVLVEYLASGEHAEAAHERIRAEAHTNWVPELVAAEVGHALRRGVTLGQLDAVFAREALWELRQMPLHWVGHEQLILYAWELRENVTFYDALYVALAEMLDQPLITFDARLARASGIQAEVELVGVA
jgi:predicted nucleic acid-binding protein